jgi:quercetin dioxygenase-like cupin family protein
MASLPIRKRNRSRWESEGSSGTARAGSPSLSDADPPAIIEETQRSGPGPYFDTGSIDTAPAGATWFDLSGGGDVPQLELAPGLTTCPVIGHGLALSYVHFEPHAVAPVHAHAEEQIVLVLEGQVEFEVAGESRTIGPGMGIVIPPFVSHGARTRESPCTEVDVFHPPRQGLVERLGSLRYVQQPADESLHD